MGEVTENRPWTHPFRQTQLLSLGPPPPRGGEFSGSAHEMYTLQCVNLIYYRTVVLFIDFLFYLAIKIFYSKTNKLKTLVDNRGIKNLATFEKER